MGTDVQDPSFISVEQYNTGKGETSEILDLPLKYPLPKFHSYTGWIKRFSCV